ncbi:EPHX4 hydrolase, partial [Heliornis fulica]|nr:EPHX4 hydrolase [Heliornis fulica]
ALRRLVTRLWVTVTALAVGVVYALWGLWVLLRRGPRQTFRWRVRDRPPPSLVTPRCHHHHHLPPTRFCWRYLLQEFSTQYRVVALDLRGYGASEKPPDKESYRLEVLLEDIRQVIEALATPEGQQEVTSATTCVLVGHDWGGLLAWEVAANYPAMVEKLVVMDAPDWASVMGFITSHPLQFLRSSYMFLFQLPWLPELLFSLADFELVKSGLTGPSTGIQNPARRLTEQEVESYLYSLSQPGGLAPPIHYYRNLF